MNLCLTCSDKKPLRDKAKKKAKWLIDLKRNNALPNKNLPRVSSRYFYPEKATVSITIRIAREDNGRKILFWAAMPKRIDDTTIMSAPEAYGDYENMGVTKMREDGFVEFKIMAPRPYKESNMVWPPHLHYCYANTKEWSKVVYAVAAYPGHHGRMVTDGKEKKVHEYTMRCLLGGPSSTAAIHSFCTMLHPRMVHKYRRHLIVVSALKPPYTIDIRGAKKHLILHYEEASDDEVKRACDKIKNHAYVVYCAKKSCHAASRLITRMIRFGARNVYYMPEGKVGWDQK